jgi:hypothetical protein
MKKIKNIEMYNFNVLNIATLKIALIIKIIPYSLKKIKTNNKPPISTLNPLISSLSPSNKSKGARLVSIKETRVHKTIQNNKISIRSMDSIDIEKDLIIDKTIMKTIIKATSKDKLCNIPRKLPNLENLLVLLHPVKIIA